ncbi:MAG: hypothetical protein KKG47_11610 [Proteobacteria bacterium]|nr:hypothetical protein [Pseudomonadota bacterium]MBU1739458.1 hypothetical protein [Pseudomonadota bacterium]
MLKKYLRFSAAALVLLFSIDRFVVSGSCDLLSWALLFLAVLSLIHAFFRERSPSSMGKLVSILLVPLTLLSNLLLLIVLVLIAFNYPPAKPVAPRIKIVQPPPDQAAGYAELFTLLENGEQACYSLPGGFSWQKDRYDYAYQGMAEILNERCGAERGRLLDFITAGVTGKPFSEIEGQLGLPMSEPIPRYKNLVDLYRIELLDLTRMIDEGRSAEAFAGYLLLWRGVRNRLDSRDGLVNAMASIAMAGFLADFFETGILALDQGMAEELLESMDRMPALLDSSLAGGLMIECAAISSFMLQDQKGAVPLIVAGPGNDLYRSLVARFLRWPFFDVNANRDFIDGLFAEQIDIVYLPREQKGKKAENLNARLQEIADHPFSLVNPTGRFLNAIAMPAVDSYDGKKEAVKARITALTWLLKSVAGKDPGLLPENSVNGERFVVEEQDGFLKISGGNFFFRVRK